MKKYTCLLIALSAISSFSFTQAFDQSVVMAVGGLDACNGSDISDSIRCTQLEGSFATCAADKVYRMVENGQAFKDVISEQRTECEEDGCTNILNNPSPKGSQNCETRLVTIEIDPVNGAE